jgi:hypothetical protein
MGPEPVVRYMLPCEDCTIDSGGRRVNILGLISNLVALDDPPYPVLCRELCVFVAVTEGRGQGAAKVVCIFEETGETVFESPQRQVAFPPDPLQVTMFVFRIRDCPFPLPGMYSLQFSYNGSVLDERPIRLR